MRLRLVPVLLVAIVVAPIAVASPVSVYEDASGPAAVSVYGNATSECAPLSPCLAAVSVFGDATGGCSYWVYTSSCTLVAASATRNATLAYVGVAPFGRAQHTLIGASVTGNGHGCWSVYGVPCPGVSVVGDAGGGIAVTGTGNAEAWLVAVSGGRAQAGLVGVGATEGGWGTLGASAFGPAGGFLAVSAAGDASGVAAIGGGSASGSLASVSLLGPAGADTLAVSVFGDAEADWMAVSVFGDARGLRPVSVFGHAEGMYAYSVCEIAAPDACGAWPGLP